MRKNEPKHTIAADDFSDFYPRFTQIASGPSEGRGRKRLYHVVQPEGGDMQGQLIGYFAVYVESQEGPASTTPRFDEAIDLYNAY